ncbi:ethanolamine ammonia-lyase subunit EutC [Marinomonas epiphytica]
MSHYEGEPANSVTANPWHKLNAYTDARIGLGRSGVSTPTKHLLDFQLAHAQAIDAVHAELNVEQLKEQFSQTHWAPEHPPFCLQSQAQSRAIYLQRPDLGRLLKEDSALELSHFQQAHQAKYDLAIAIVDGLSSLAVEQNALPLMNALIGKLSATSLTQQSPWTIAPICFVRQGRVAIGDDICERLNASCVLVLIGERPGLSSPDSLGLYLTWGGKVGLTDAFRNCISNIRPAGLNYPEAAHKAAYLLNEARQLKLSGVKLKDRSDDAAIESHTASTQNFLIP